jgi:hypothetical protein
MVMEIVARLVTVGHTYKSANAGFVDFPISRLLKNKTLTFVNDSFVA